MISSDELTSPARQVRATIGGIAGVFIYLAFIAALFFLGVLVFGGRINFWQAFVVAVYTLLPVSIVNRVLSTLLLYLKSPDEIHPIRAQETLVQDNLGILFSPAENPVLFVLASTIGILSFYLVWLRTVGLRNAGEKVSSTTAWAIPIIIFLLWVGMVTIITALFPAFVS